MAIRRLTDRFAGWSGVSNTFCFEHLLQFTGLSHFPDDIATADELAFYIKLGDGRSVRKLLYALAKFHVLKDIDTLKFYLQC